MRQEELLGLQWEEVRDITREFAAIRQGEAPSVGNRAAVQGPKGGAERLELAKV